MKQQRIFTLIIGLLLASNIQAQSYAWGYNLNGQLGNGLSVSNQPTPQIVAALADATGASGGLEFSVFQKPNGTLAAAGDNQYGQLGTGTAGGRSTTPVAVSLVNGITQISSGGYHTIALTSAGGVVAWGFNFEGELGNGTVNTTGCFCSPTRVDSTITNVAKIEAGFFHNLALKNDGTVWAWGDNSAGQLGDGTTTNRSSPVQVGVGVSGFSNIIAVSAGEFHSAALKSDGTVWVWGFNGNGQIGNGTANGVFRSPVLNTTLTGITQLSAGAYHNIARKTDGTIWVWGFNRNGQVGNGSNEPGDQLTPVQNATLTNIIDVGTNGGYTNFVRRRDGSLNSWGRSVTYGTVGDGTFTDRYSPVTTLVGSGNAVIGAGIFQNFALKPSFATGTGSNLSFYGENVRFNFANISVSGTLSYSAIDPTATGLAVPAGYVLQENAPAYNITTTAATAGNISVCLTVPSTYDLSLINRLKILHGENGSLVDRTSSVDFRKREICATVTSLSPFVIAEGLAPTAANVAISGRVFNQIGRPLSRAEVRISDANGNVKIATTNQFGFYGFEEIEAGRNYIVQVTAKGASFQAQFINANDNIAELNFYAE